jgi:hypothetical protein
MYIERFFVPGHAELSSRTGAPVFISEKAPATFVHHDCKEGDRIPLGTIKIEVIETPGGMHAVRPAKRPRLPAVELDENALTWEI